jgi:hypothetical protein
MQQLRRSKGMHRQLGKTGSRFSHEILKVSLIASLTGGGTPPCHRAK